MKKTILLPLLFGGAVIAQQKPNILWLTFEDTSPQFIGCYGNKDARTPVIDRLAKEGVRFTNAFSTGTVCSPSRTALITGVKTYLTGTGHHRSNFSIPGFIKGFPSLLQQEGYYTSNNSKTDYNVANEKQFTTNTWNESSGTAGWWKRKPNQPFFAVFNFMDSHQSRTMTDTYSWYLKNVFEKLPVNERIGENEFDMPPFYNDSPAMRKQFARVYNSIKLTDNKIGELLKRLEKDHLRDSTIIFLFADHGEGIPRGKTNGINLGYRVPFIVWIPEMYKHLSPWGTGGVITDELIDFSDLAPTLISLAGGTVPGYLSGRILMGKTRSKNADHLVLSADRSDNGPDLVRSVTDGKYMYSRNFMPYMPEARYIRYMEIGEIKQQMRKDLKENKLNTLQKSIFQDRPAEFLFDTENDQWETKNLANDPAYAELLEKMRSRLKAEVLQSRDVMLLPEYELGLLPGDTTPYEYRLSETNFPVSAIYEAASLSGFRGKEIAQKQVKMLGSANKIVRYWAIIGLRSQNKTDLTPFSNEIHKAMNDAYPPVSITASAISYEVFNNPTAGEILKKYCSDANKDLSLLTLNFLLYVTNKHPFIETVQMVHKTKGAGYNIKAGCMDFLGSMGLVPNTFENRE